MMQNGHINSTKLKTPLSLKRIPSSIIMTAGLEREREVSIKQNMDMVAS